MGRNSDDQVSEPLARGASLGRYVVLGLLGRGGMGEVYAAFDPELDRKVAVKLLRARTENGVSISEGRQRTLREAQAIARLSHPNVVTVYDVGTFREQVFIAMEFVDGNTASYWVQAQPRTWQEILKVYLVAGRGLQAAHEKGLVHRDFKPENVMVARDGEVRVMDFGLAREIDVRGARHAPVTTTTAKFGDLRTDGGTMVLHQARPDAPPVALANADGVVREMQDTQPSSTGADLFGARLTRTGAIMGTPAYMAPEQFFKAATDARSDQFSFCVTLYEALYGERPFPGNNIQTLVGNIVQGNIRPPPAGTKVPVWVRKVLLRGLRPTAAERYPSMAELLDALKTDPRAKYRRFAFGLTLGLVPLMLGFGVRVVVADKPPVCTDGGERLASIWELTASDAAEGPRQRRIHEAFLSTGKGYAADVYLTVRRALSDYAHRWSSLYKETCEATHLRHEQSPDVLDLRMSCLNERLNGLRALTEVLAGANGETVENAVSATAALPSLGRCSDVQTLRIVIRPPEDPVVIARVNDFRQRLADATARFDAGRWKEALEQTPKLVSTARQIGYKPILAEALELQGKVYLAANDTPASEQAMIEAFSVADAARHDEVRVRVATSLVYILGYEQKNFAEARRWFTVASAVLERLGGHDLERAWLLNNMGCAYFVHHDVDEGMAAMERSLSLKEKLLGAEQLDFALSEGNLSYLLSELGRFDEALTYAQRSIAMAQRKLGTDHPLLANELSNEGDILNALGRYSDAQKVFTRARDILEKELGPRAAALPTALAGFGVSLLGQGRYVDAISILERALKLMSDRYADPQARADALFALAQATWQSRRDPRRARQFAIDARDAFAASAKGAKVNAVDAWLAEHSAS